MIDLFLIFEMHHYNVPTYELMIDSSFINIIKIYLLNQLDHLKESHPRVF